MLRNVKIGIKLMLAFFLIAFLSVALIGYIAYSKGKASLEEESFNRLTAVREMKATQIEDYFSHIQDQIITFSSNPTVVQAMVEFKEAFNTVDQDLGIGEEQLKGIQSRVETYYENDYLPRLNNNKESRVTLESELSQNEKTLILQDLYIASNRNPVGDKHNLNTPGDTSTYSGIHETYHPYIRHFLEKFGYYDIFLIDDETGHIVYTVFKEVDYGTSLLTGPFASTNFGDVFRAARISEEHDFVKLVDYHPYHPSYNQHASFIASPIYDGEERVGVLVFQMPIDKIDDIMTSRRQWKKVGLGASGETYIVGEDFTLRNQSRFLIEDSVNYFKMIEEIGLPKATIAKIRNTHRSIGLQVVETIGTKDALKGNTDTKIFPDYRGVPVLSSYKPLNIEGMKWVIMSEIDEEEAFHHINALRDRMIIALIGLIVLISLTSLFVARRITKPLKHLTGGAKQLAKGNMDAEINVPGKDEIGILALSFRKMQVSIRNLIEELKDINQNLEQKVADRTRELQHQKEMIEEKNKEIVDSITYAKRLQDALLPTEAKMQEHLLQSFILFKPKDIVSGDFYWMDIRGDELLIAAVDCTGHGVPGAMVSVVGSNGLTRCVKEFGLREPAAIMDKLTDLVIETFEASSGSDGDDDVKDGMDMALCSINLKTRKLMYAGANNPLWVIRADHDQVHEIKADKQPIGKFEFRKPFANHELQLREGDAIYIFSDGYADQFGGPRGKKFKYKTLRDLLMELRDRPMDQQREILDITFENWRGDLEQIDDVCMIGLRV